MAMEVEDERLTQAYGSTMKALKTHTHLHVHMHPLIKTLNGKSGSESVNQMFNYHPPSPEFIEVVEY